MDGEGKGAIFYTRGTGQRYQEREGEGERKERCEIPSQRKLSCLVKLSCEPPTPCAFFEIQKGIFSGPKIQNKPVI